MLFRSLRTGSLVVVALLGSMSAASLHAQYPFGAASCSRGYGAPIQANYGNPGHGGPGYGPWGQPGMPMNPYGPPMGYGGPAPMPQYGGYPSPAVNVNQSFYPGSTGNPPNPHHHSSHQHSSHNHPWHLGHYLFGT